MLKHLPSASQMYRLANCPGSFSLIRQLDAEGKLRQESSVDADLGTRIHAALEGEPEYLNASEQEIKDDCSALADRAMRQFCAKGEVRTYYEERLYYRFGDTHYFTAKPDLVCIDSEGNALDINFKTGRRDAGEPSSNLQLRTEVCLIARSYGSRRIGATLVQPLVTRSPEIVVYDENDIRKAESDILGYVDASLWVKDRSPGEWCIHCPGRAFCTEAHRYALVPRPDPEISHLQLPIGDDGALFLERVETAYKILDAIWDHYKRLVTEKIGVIPDWHLSEGREVRYVKDVPNAARLSSGELVESKIAIGRLEEFMKKKWGMTGRAFDSMFDKTFGPFIGKKTTEGSLERIPKKLLK